MKVLNPRTRSVITRLSDVEYEQIKAAFRVSGCRSLSDFARRQLLQDTKPARKLIDKDGHVIGKLYDDGTYKMSEPWGG